MSQLRVFFLPELVDAEDLSGTTVVVIDVLRATTTIVAALAAGAECVIPCLEVEEAQQRAALDRPCSLLGGERGGLPIDGFDLGNSPAEYTPGRVAGKTIVFTTTNGTRALRHAHRAARVLVAAFVNFAAVCRRITDSPHDAIHLLCAGTAGQITREDVLLAGALATACWRTSGGGLQLNDQAIIAADAWQQVQASFPAAPLATCLRQSCGGRNLLRIGCERDIELAAQLDLYPCVPEFDPDLGDVRLR